MRELFSIPVIIEIPTGSRNKYEWDPSLNRFRYDRMLFSSVHYPADYGFIPETFSEDGDALDALVLVAEPTFPGCYIESKPVGLFKMEDEKGLDYKILCVPVGDPLWNYVDDIDEVPPHLLNEIATFFEIYKSLEAKEVTVEGWMDREAALKVIESDRRRFARRERRVS
ncbi:MAG: inorganic diphosphatase [Actinobacteria bacterium]|nr:inorganic diphosphatase [Actinomycetota bacterium]